MEDKLFTSSYSKLDIDSILLPITFEHLWEELNTMEKKLL
jgi:hypothetical protein